MRKRVPAGRGRSGRARRPVSVSRPHTKRGTGSWKLSEHQPLQAADSQLPAAIDWGQYVESRLEDFQQR